MQWLKNLLDNRETVQIIRFNFEKYKSYPIPYDISKIDMYINFKDFFKNKYNNEIVYFCKITDDKYYIEFINEKGELLTDYVVKFSTYKFGVHKASMDILEEIKYVKNYK